MKRHATGKRALAFAAAAGSLCLAAAARGDDLKIDCCASDGTATDFARAASDAREADCCAELDSRVKELEAAASAKGNAKTSLTVEGVVIKEVGREITR